MKESSIIHCESRITPIPINKDRPRKSLNSITIDTSTLKIFLKPTLKYDDYRPQSRGIHPKSTRVVDYIHFDKHNTAFRQNRVLKTLSTNVIDNLLELSILL